ncbi:MAG: hypothetical protein GY940_46195, partial [bacterium]|nr:hypothetical protein [bacterium]
LFKMKVFDEAGIEEKLGPLRKMYFSANDKVSRLLNVPLEDDSLSRISIVDFYRYDNASTGQVRDYLKARDQYWSQPRDTGFCSTNCRINDVGIYVHRMKRGFHSYSVPLSWDCRLGQHNREEALEELQAFPPQKVVRNILKQIGYEDEHIKDAVVTVRRDSGDNPFLCAYIIPGTGYEEEELKQYLDRELPHFMIPRFILQVDEIPLLPNGKKDIKALPEPRFGKKSGNTAPQNPCEKQLVK